MLPKPEPITIVPAAGDPPAGSTHAGSARGSRRPHVRDGRRHLELGLIVACCALAAAAIVSLAIWGH